MNITRKSVFKAILFLASSTLIVSTSCLLNLSENDNKRETKSLRDAIQFIEGEAIFTTNCDGKKIKEAYSFPIVPGTVEWNNFKTRDEMMAATQIPIEMLENMTTEALANTVMNHPLLSTIMLAYDHSELPFVTFSGDFNGAKELMNRKDAAIQLAKLYVDAKVARAGKYEKQESEEEASFVDLITTEAVLNVPQVFSLLNKEEAKAVSAIANGKGDERTDNKNL